jgi:lipase ATG15
LIARGDLTVGTCNKTCLADYITARDSYFQISMAIYQQITKMYPGVSVWFTGHSLGGALAAIAGLATGRPAITFEAPGDRLFAERIGVLQSPIKYNEDNIWHFGVLSDPIFSGRCTGKLSACYLAGYAIETQCHTGNICLLDTNTNIDIRNHRMINVLQIIENKESFMPICFPELPDCKDCGNWAELRR